MSDDLEKITGVHAVLEILVARDRKVDKLYLIHGTRRGRLKEIEDRALFLQIPVAFIAPSQLAKICGHNHHQGVLAMVRSYPFATLNEILSMSIKNKTAPFLLILDQIQDPRNLGAILRNAEGAGVDGIIITSRRSSAITSTVVKTSAGASEHLKICRVMNLVQTLETLKDLGIWIYGTDLHEATTSLYEVDGKDAIALVIGNEEKGIRPLVKKNCDWLIKIPMSGKIESLNAAASAALVLYEIRRQRSFSGNRPVDKKPELKYNSRSEQLEI